jgi:glycosyltransferase involved in cell wall biosynthesis
MDYLGITRSGHTAINRKLYELLALRGYTVGLVFPSKLKLGMSFKPHEPITETSISCFPMETTSENPRLTCFIGLRKYLTQAKPNFIYTEFDPASLLLVYLRFVKPRNTKIICISCENLDIRPLANAKREGFKGLVLGTFKTILARLSKPGIHHVQVLSKDGIDVFRKLGYKKLSVAHLGFDETLFKRDESKRAEKKTELGLTKPVIAYFGRIVPEKGIHVLLEALNKIKHLEWHFLMDTFNTYANSYASTITSKINELKLEDRMIKFDASHTEIWKYMNASDICVVPSQTSKKWKEQFGRVAPESMACGNTIVVSDSGTLKEIVINNGFIFSEKSVNSLVEILAELIQNPDKVEKYSKKAIGRASQFTLKNQVNTILDID